MVSPGTGFVSAVTVSALITRIKLDVLNMTFEKKTNNHLKLRAKNIGAKYDIGAK